MEVEVGEVLFESKEVVEVEHFAQRACAVEVVHLAVARIEGACHVHDLRAQGGHTGTAAHPNHLFLAVENGVKVAVGAAHNHLVAGLERENIAAGDTGHHVHKSGALVFGFERWRGNAHGEHKAVALGGIIGH